MNEKTVPSLLDYATTEVEEITEEQARILTILLTHEIHGGGKEIIDEAKGSFIYKIIEKRLALVKDKNLKVSTWAIVFVTCLCKTPADAVMWAYAFKTLYQKDRKEVTLAKLCEIFFNGFPTEKMRKHCWDRQKGIEFGLSIDNMLDTIQPWIVR